MRYGGPMLGIGPYESATRSSVNGPSGTPAPTEFLVGADDPVRPGPDNATPCRAGPVCPAVGAEKEESPSYGFAAPLGKGAKEIRIATTSDIGHWFRNDREFCMGCVSVSCGA